jgi:hypothetical protein
MSRPTRPTHNTSNWPAYNEALKRRGSLTLWFDPTMAWEVAPTGKRGRQPDYSASAIQTCLTMKVLFGMALRQTTGFVESLLRLIGLNWAVPDFSTLSRRQKNLKVNIPYRESDGVCQSSCPPISCGVSDFSGAYFGFGVEPDGSSGLPVAGFA